LRLRTTLAECDPPACEREREQHFAGDPCPEGKVRRRIQGERQPRRHEECAKHRKNSHAVEKHERQVMRQLLQRKKLRLNFAIWKQ
jgi:hypothetical protein